MSELPKAAIEAAEAAMREQFHGPWPSHVDTILEAALPHLPGLSALTDDEVDWLEGAARRASGDDIASANGAAEPLRNLADKLRAELDRRAQHE